MKKEPQFKKFDSVSIYCTFTNTEIKGFLLAERHVDVYSENRWGQLEYTHTEYRAVCLLTSNKQGLYVPVTYYPTGVRRNRGGRPGMKVFLTRSVLVEKSVLEQYYKFFVDLAWI